MKLFGAAPLAIAFVAASLQFAPNLQAQSQREPNAQQEEQQQKAQTFMGKVVKARNGQYALLIDEQSGKGVYLDDQEKAMAFEGKSVTVTGTLEVAKNLVHVMDIQPAA